MRGRSSGFTLIEALLSLVITSFLLAAVLQVVALLARDGEREVERTMPARTRLLELLRRDLESAWRLDGRRGGLRLLTHRSLSGEPAPVLVEYEVSDGFLVRRERQPASRTSDDTRAELVLPGVARFEVAGAPPAEEETPDGAALLDEPRSVPDRLTLALTAEGAMTEHWVLVLR